LSWPFLQKKRTFFCCVVPLPSNTIFVRKTLNLSSGPTGRLLLENLKKSLTCCLALREGIPGRDWKKCLTKKNLFWRDTTKNANKKRFAFFVKHGQEGRTTTTGFHFLFQKGFFFVYFFCCVVPLPSNTIFVRKTFPSLFFFKVNKTIGNIVYIWKTIWKSSIYPFSFVLTMEGLFILRKKDTINS